MITTVAANDSSATVLNLSLEVTDPNVIAYLTAFEGEQVRCEMAHEALKVGVIAIRSASPTLDTTVVQAKFSDMEARLRDYVDEFMTAVQGEMATYFKDQDGLVPKSLQGAFGEHGQLARTFQQFFDPSHGRLATLMQQQIGPASVFGRALDPKNKDGILALIEAKVQSLIEGRLEVIVGEFSLDNEASAMCRLQKLLNDSFTQINQSLGIKAATALEAQRGHVKGIEFERDLYDVVSTLGRQLGDATELTRGLFGAIRRKTGDYVVTLGDTSGAPGTRIVMEVKDQPLKMASAIDELQEAKANREAAIGILVFARGNEPCEVGDFRKVGEDFYITVDKEDLAAGRPLVFLEAAYRIARELAVAAERKQAAGELDVQGIAEQVDALAAWSDRIADMVKKSRTIQSSGKSIEECAADLRNELEQRLARILEMLRTTE